jgi:hypothetical protein
MGLGYYVDTKDFKKLHRDIATFAKRAYPYAVRNALNGCAFELRKGWQVEIRRAFTTRNSFTERSIRVEKAAGTDIRSMQAVTGSVAPYMGDQEYGGTVRGRGKHKAIPSPVAGGGKAGGGKRPRMVAGRFKLSAISAPTQPIAKYGRRRQNAVVLAMAIRKGERFALLNRAKGKGRGIFEIKGLKRKAKTRLIWNVSKGSVKVMPEPTMRTAVLRSKHAFERVLHDSIVSQLKRNKVFGY